MNCNFYSMDGRPDEGQSGFGKHDNAKRLLRDKINENPGTQIIFVGSVNCLRHRPYVDIGTLMQEGKVSILSPTMGDFSSGKYINQIEEAILELSEERDCKKFMIVGGCQWVILSTDGELIVDQMKNEHGIDVKIAVDDHLEFGDHG